MQSFPSALYLSFKTPPSLSSSFHFDLGYDSSPPLSLMELGYTSYLTDAREELKAISPSLQQTGKKLLSIFKEDNTKVGKQVQKAIGLKKTPSSHNFFELLEVLSFFSSFFSSKKFKIASLGCSEEELAALITVLPGKEVNATKAKTSSCSEGKVNFGSKLPSSFDFYLDLSLSGEEPESVSFPILWESLRNLQKGLNSEGNVVFRFGDANTLPWIQALWILASFFSELHFYKPSGSLSFTTSRFVFAKGFKKPKKILSFPDLDKTKTLLHLFPSSPDSLFKLTVAYHNSKVSKHALLFLQRILRYLSQNQPKGPLYQEYRQLKKEALNRWLKVFNPPLPTALEKARKEILEHTSKRLSLISKRLEIIK